MIYEPPITTNRITIPHRNKLRAAERKLLQEDRNVRNCPVCSVVAKLVEHPRGEAFRCPKCRLVFGERPLAQGPPRNAVEIGVRLKAARKVAHERKNLKLQQEDYRDPTYRAAILDRAHRKYAANNNHNKPLTPADKSSSSLM
jgi:Zn-finger nucleic acid-binding protein